MKKRGIPLFLIVLILNSSIISAFDLNQFSIDKITSLIGITGKATQDIQDEKSLIESCRFKSSGPDVVLQKTPDNLILMWLYEPNKERFGDLKLITDLEKVNENKYNFRIEETGPIYTVTATIPDFCTRPQEETSQAKISTDLDECIPATTDSLGNKVVDATFPLFPENPQDTSTFNIHLAFASDGSLQTNNPKPYVQYPQDQNRDAFLQSIGNTYGPCQGYKLDTPSASYSINIPNGARTLNINSNSFTLVAKQDIPCVYFYRDFNTNLLESAVNQCGYTATGTLPENPIAENPPPETLSIENLHFQSQEIDCSHLGPSGIQTPNKDVCLAQKTKNGESYCQWIAQESFPCSNAPPIAPLQGNNIITNIINFGIGILNAIIGVFRLGILFFGNLFATFLPPHQPMCSQSQGVCQNADGIIKLEKFFLEQPILNSPLASKTITEKEIKSGDNIDGYTISETDPPDCQLSSTQADYGNCKDSDGPVSAHSFETPERGDYCDSTHTVTIDGITRGTFLYEKVCCDTGEVGYVRVNCGEQGKTCIEKNKNENIENEEAYCGILGQQPPSTTPPTTPPPTPLAPSPTCDDKAGSFLDTSQSTLTDISAYISSQDKIASGTIKSECDSNCNLVSNECIVNGIYAGYVEATRPCPEGQECLTESDRSYCGILSESTATKESQSTTRPTTTRCGCPKEDVDLGKIKMGVMVDLIENNPENGEFKVEKEKIDVGQAVISSIETNYIKIKYDAEKKTNYPEFEVVINYKKKELSVGEWILATLFFIASDDLYKGNYIIIKGIEQKFFDMGLGFDLVDMVCEKSWWSGDCKSISVTKSYDPNEQDNNLKKGVIPNIPSGTLTIKLRKDSSQGLIVEIEGKNYKKVININNVEQAIKVYNSFIFERDHRIDNGVLGQKIREDEQQIILYKQIFNKNNQIETRKYQKRTISKNKPGAYNSKLAESLINNCVKSK